MNIALIIGIIAFGILFLFIEAFFLPGLAVVGILGGLMMIGGVYLMYDGYGSFYGHISLAATVAIAGWTIYYGFRRLWLLKWSVREQVNSRVNELEEHVVSIGEKGVAFTALRPNGRVLFGEIRVEVFSIGEFVDKGTGVEVVKITANRIYVKPLNI